MTRVLNLTFEECSSKHTDKSLIRHTSSWDFSCVDDRATGCYTIHLILLKEDNINSNGHVYHIYTPISSFFVCDWRLKYHYMYNKKSKQTDGQKDDTFFRQTYTNRQVTDPLQTLSRSLNNNMAKQHGLSL